MRLWNTNDGRCIIGSTKDLLLTKALAIHTVEGFVGHVFVIGDEGDLSIINVMTMTTHAH